MRVKKYRHPILVEKDKVAKELFYDRCFWCLQKYGKFFSFHHLNYPPGELTYSSFNNTINYHKYILPRIIKEPDRFALVCRAHHHFVEIFAAIKDEQKWLRFFMLVCCTDGVKGGESTPSNPTTICLENENVVRSYQLSSNSSLKKLLMKYCNIDSMFGDIKLESK